jgi:DNA repair exonuclease SbcCD ATPase subunit
MRLMQRAFLTSAAALLVAGVPTWSRQDQPQSQSPQSQQQSPSAPGQSPMPAPAAQQDSLAAAARKAREQKKEAPKATRVFTNDNIPTAGGISSVGQAQKPGPASAATTSVSASSEEAKWRERFAKLRHKLEQDQADLDVMQRELGVLNTQYYSDPNKELQQQLSREDINKKTADIEAKKKDLEADKQAISDAEDELRRADGDPGWANPQ